MAGERRRYLRVLFEETIEVQATEWTDPMASGLDISLNGTRFHCEHSLSEGEEVTIAFRSDIKLKGEVRWCWPIEWYYQAAIEFNNINSEEQRALRDYITEVTGEPYPEYSEEENAGEETEEAAEIEDDGSDVEDLVLEEESIESFDFDESEEETLFEEAEEESLELEEQDDEDEIESPLAMDGGLTPLSFSGKRLVILDENNSYTEVLQKYLKERTGIDVDYIPKKSSLWPHLKGKSINMILLGWQNESEESIETLNEINERFPEIPVIFLSGPINLEERLHGLNAGAVDFLSRPIHLSAIAQSILIQMASISISSSELKSEDEDEDGDDIALTDDFTDDFNLESSEY